MELSNLIAGEALRVVQGDPKLPVADLTDDSRQVAAGALFIARTGAVGEGSRYVRDAVERGAAAVICPEASLPDPLPQGVTILAGPRIDQAFAGRLAERFFGEPSRQLALVGVTGTNGKTTTAYLIQYLIRRAGLTCGMIGTVVIDDGLDRRPAELTTPGAIELSRLLRRMVDHDCRVAVMEVSSHALHQGRVDALGFDVGVFTNLTGDHLDYHGDMASYANAKARLFELLPETGWAILNADDPTAQRMAEAGPARVVWTSLQPAPDAGSVESDDEPDGPEAPGEAQSICRASILELAADASLGRFTGPWGSVECRLPLVGRHNVSNVLQAIAAANTITPMFKRLRGALMNCPSVPGRLEPVRRPTDGSPGDQGDPQAHGASWGRGLAQPAVLVDYAHTHDALENVLLALRPVTPGRLICVFGCGGDRDRTKRPKMADVACRIADRIVITSDNPRTEDPLAIINEVKAGVPTTSTWKVTVEPDRAAAIRLALTEAREQDTVLIAGKGHEDYQIIGTSKHHFDDREQAREALRAWRPEAQASSS